jgi:hypothetical protein
MEVAMAAGGQDPWEKAAACEAHAQNSRDERIRAKFRKLRDSWIRIANSAQFVGDLTQYEEHQYQEHLRKEEGSRK